MDMGGEEAIRKMNRQANEMLVEQLGMQNDEGAVHRFGTEAGGGQKEAQGGEPSKKQMMELEKEKMQQNNRMEQLVTALLRQMGGSSPFQCSQPVEK